MSSPLEPLNDELFAPLTVDEQDALLGGLDLAVKGTLTHVGLTAVAGSLVQDYVPDFPGR